MPSTIDLDEKFTPRPAGRRPTIAYLLIALAFFAITSRSIASFLLDYVWWGSVGQSAVWWEQANLSTIPVAVATLICFALFWLVHARALKAAGTSIREQGSYAGIATGVLFVISLLIASRNFAGWGVARFFAGQQVSATGVADPIFGKPLTFYFFELPFYQQMLQFGVVLCLAASAIYFIANRLWASKHQFGQGQVQINLGDLLRLDGPLRFLLPLAVALFAGSVYLGRYEYLTNQHAFLTGVDYVDANVRLPFNTLLSFSILAGALFLALRKPFFLAIPVVLFLVQGVVPGIVNSLYVKPNELNLQRPYLQHHIAMTRAAYGLDQAQTLRYDAGPGGSMNTEKYKDVLSNVRLWDWRAFHDTVAQIQPLRPYVFEDSDVDRYTIDGKMRQLLVSPRELEIQQLGEARNRWPNTHVVYTHGYGVVAADASRITADGLPNLLIQDAPPKVHLPGYTLKRPQIYFGEVAHEPVYVRTAQPEFDYPSGSENMHTHYEGSGGIPIGGMGMRLLAALSYSDINVLLSSDLKGDSQMLINRQVAERLGKLAGFLVWDHDPYMVVTRDGRLIWMVDGYTASDAHPYAASSYASDAGRFNYLRNAVKATVDAYTGETKLYVFSEEPIIQAWQKLFPTLLRPRSEMPKELQEHARYPERLFQVQARAQLIYHMKDPESFYNKADVWDVANRVMNRQEDDQDQATDAEEFQRRAVAQRQGKIQHSPNFMVMDAPGDDRQEMEFMLSLPFTPRGKDNLIGIMMGRSDGENLGKLIFLELPKEQLYFGPMQIESRINQDQNISKDMTLWNQQGSQVLRGQMAVLPIDNQILFVQPIYLQSAQARMPQLKKVVVATGNRLIYADTYDQALVELGAGATIEAKPGTPKPAMPTGTAEAPVTMSTNDKQKIDNIRGLMQRYRNAAQQGQWAEAGKILETVESELRK